MMINPVTNKIIAGISLRTVLPPYFPNLVKRSLSQELPKVALRVPNTPRAIMMILAMSCPKMLPNLTGSRET